MHHSVDHRHGLLRKRKQKNKEELSKKNIEIAVGVCSVALKVEFNWKLDGGY